MKKLNYFFGAALLSATLVGCTNDEVFDENITSSNEIEMNVYSGKNATRAVDATIGGTFTSFKTYCTTADAKGDFNDVYTYNTTTSKWGWASSHTWPSTEASYPMRFYALADNASPNTAYALLPGVPPATAKTYIYTVPDFSAQVDLLACMQTAVRKPVGGTLPFPFKHALSKVAFKLKVGAGVKLVLISMKIRNINSVGTITLDNNALSWGTIGTTRDYVHCNFTSETGAVYDNSANASATVFNVKTTTGATDQSMMLLPQTAAAWDLITNTIARFQTGTFIEMIYRMEDASGKNLIGFKNTSPATPYYVKVGLPLYTGTYNTETKTGTLTWNNGYVYTYTISLGTPDSSDGYLTDGKFVNADGTSTTVGVRIPAGGTANTDPTQGDVRNLNDPLTTSDINLNVTIEPWLTGESVNVN